VSRSFADRLRFYSTLKGHLMWSVAAVRLGSAGGLCNRLSWRLTDRLRLPMEIRQWSESR